MSHNHPNEGGRQTAAVLSLVVGVGMLLGKWGAYLITGSHAILSDALESVVHVAATAFALLSIRLSARPPDPKYPYGYGKVTFFSAGFEGGLIALAALAILYEAIQGFIRGEPLRRLDVGMVIILIASVVNLALGFWLIHKGKTTRSLILEADGEHVLTDSYTSFGVLAGVALVWVTKLEWLDGVVAIAVAINILWTGYRLVREAVTGLMDRADPQVLAKIVDALQQGRRPGWIDLHQLRSWQSGDRTYVDFHLVVPEDWSVVQLHETNDAARDLLRSALGTPTDVIIHFDPDMSRFDPQTTWTVERAVRVPGPDDPAFDADEAEASVVEGRSP
ncbi:MAG TPA: cation diffusion facilitator family transporter [Isosphaeraceae bacterium]|jgi:cation diffusion facilitator family transporter|nr:cation diffusion facilitator family transporter [Isosphaeraceae bacterium]